MYVNRFIQKYTDVIQIHVYFVEKPISAQYRKHKIYNIFTVIYKHFVSDKNHCMLSMPINKLSMNAINCCKTTDIWQELIFKQINNELSSFLNFTFHIYITFGNVLDLEEATFHKKKNVL